MTRHRTCSLLSVLLLVLGTVVCGYLLMRHWAIAGSSVSTTDFCGLVFGTSCDETLQSSSSVWLGMPLAGWGLVFYSTVTALLVLGWSLGEDFQPTAIVAAWLLTLVAAILGIALMGAMLLEGKTLCPLCAAVHGINLLLVVTIQVASSRSTRQLADEVTKGLAYAIGTPPIEPGRVRWQVVGLLTAMLIGVAIFQWVLVEERAVTTSTGERFDSRQTIELYESIARQEVPVDKDDASLGDSQARVQLVVFSDFQCRACISFASRLAALRQRFGDRVQVVFKHFPLDGQCNPRVHNRPHPRACEAACAAEAARRQGRFWSFHDALFSADLAENEVLLTSIARSTGLDLARFDEDRRQPEVQAEVAADIALGNRLGIDGTPAVFLDGRRVYDTRLEALEFLIVHRLKTTASDLSTKMASTRELSPVR